MNYVITSQKIKLVFIFFLFYNLLNSQNLEGVVKDSLNNPLPNSNIIAKPLDQKEKIKFTIADNKGRYKLELILNKNYTIQVSSMGFKTINYEYNPIENIKNKDFILKESIEKLKEVVINYKYEPIVFKKDTTSFKVNAFTNGNERKLKDQLEKLPGVEVAKSGEITYQGKKVNRLMVENKSFFGGGTKLGVENIPADAIEQIDFIENFNEVGFMKDVNNSQELVMNVKLKEDKKEFVFGDLSSAYGIKNFYNLHAALFLYSPKLNLSYIGNLNNIGERVFSNEDLTRFQGGVSMYLNNRKSLSFLNDFSQNKTDFVKNTSNFNALNFNYEYSDKIDFSGFALFSKTLRSSLVESELVYLQVNTKENRENTSEESNKLASVNFKFNYNPNKNTNWLYNINSDFGNSEFESTLLTKTTQNSNLFIQKQFIENINLKHFLERHQKHNRKNTTTFVINHSFLTSTPNNDWFSTQPFLQGLLPIQLDNEIRINQLKQNKLNQLEVLLKHYYIFNSNNHLYSYLGYNHKYQNFLTFEKQNMSNGLINDFSLNGFGNNIKYLFNDYYIALEYQLKINKLTFKPAIFLHFYNISTLQINKSQNIDRVFNEPKIFINYEINTGKNLSINYKLSNDFPRADLLVENFTLQNYNSVFKGNALLLNEKYHQNSLIYNNMNLYKNIMFNILLSYNKKTKSIRNNTIIDGINQFTTPILTDNPENNWFFMSMFTKKVKNYVFKFTTSLNGFESYQEINNQININIRNSQNLGINIRTANKKWPGISIGYNHVFNQLNGVQKSKFETQNIDFNFDYELIKNIIYRIDYQWNRNIFENNRENFSILNTSFLYQKEKSKFSFEIKANNLFNTSVKYNSSFSVFQTSNQSTYILPRVLLFGLNYKL